MAGAAFLGAGFAAAFLTAGAFFGSAFFAAGFFAAGLAAFLAAGFFLLDEAIISPVAKISYEYEIGENFINRGESGQEAKKTNPQAYLAVSDLFGIQGHLHFSDLDLRPQVNFI
ncbi:MAG: hypothetical protein GC136_06995 [Alphaproteobacteria bacterium]|nr:hypothetical protein [Alphaproteobacteria bacterium]